MVMNPGESLLEDTQIRCLGALAEYAVMVGKQLA